MPQKKIYSKSGFPKDSSDISHYALSVVTLVDENKQFKVIKITALAYYGSGKSRELDKVSLSNSIKHPRDKGNVQVHSFDKLNRYHAMFLWDVLFQCLHTERFLSPHALDLSEDDDEVCDQV